AFWRPRIIEIVTRIAAHSKSFHEHARAVVRPRRQTRSPDNVITALMVWRLSGLSRNVELFSSDRTIRRRDARRRRRASDLLGVLRQPSRQACPLPPWRSGLGLFGWSAPLLRPESFQRGAF